MPEIDPGVGLGMIRRLLDQLEEELVDETVLLHGLVQDGLDEQDVIFFLFVLGRLIWKIN